MENNKMTTVEWLQEQIFNSDWKNMSGEDKLKLFDQAFQMEKEQKTKFADEYADAVMGGCIKLAEQYYKETYGN